MKYAMLTNEVLDKLCKCFNSVEEINSFCETFEEMSLEFIFLKKLREHLPKEAEASIRMKAIVMLTLFVRDNIELLRNLIQVCDITPLSTEEVEKMMEKARQKLKEEYDSESA